MAHSGTSASHHRSRGMGGRSKTSKANQQQRRYIPSVYAPDDLPESVKAVLKVMYPHSKYTKETK